MSKIPEKEGQGVPAATAAATAVVEGRGKGEEGRGKRGEKGERMALPALPRCNEGKWLRPLPAAAAGGPRRPQQQQCPNLAGKGQVGIFMWAWEISIYAIFIIDQIFHLAPEPEARYVLLNINVHCGTNQVVGATDCCQWDSESDVGASLAVWPRAGVPGVNVPPVALSVAVVVKKFAEARRRWYFFCF